MNRRLTHANTSVAADAEVLSRLLSERHSCRGFLPEPVDSPTIGKILQMAQRTASWCNAQPWQLIIASGTATERFREALVRTAASDDPSTDIPFPREYHSVYLERRRATGWQLYNAVGVAKGDRDASARQNTENFRLFGAPHVAIVTTDEALGVYGAIDCGAYISNFMLAAHSVGIASIAQASLARHSKFIRGHFGIGDDRLVVCGISFGYENVAHPANEFRTFRAQIDEAVTFVNE